MAGTWPMRTISGIDELDSLTGTELGVSGWMTVDQERIRAFAEITGDHQWIHLDADRARRESPFGAPVAHGLLTLALLPALTADAFVVENVKARINYGFGRVRFPAPVMSGARVRARIRLLDLKANGPGRHLARYDSQIEIEGDTRPACVAESLGLYVV